IKRSVPKPERKLRGGPLRTLLLRKFRNRPAPAKTLGQQARGKNDSRTNASKWRERKGEGKQFGGQARDRSKGVSTGTVCGDDCARTTPIARLLSAAAQGRGA